MSTPLARIVSARLFAAGVGLAVGSLGAVAEGLAVRARQDEVEAAGGASATASERAALEREGALPAPPPSRPAPSVRKAIEEAELAAARRASHPAEAEARIAHQRAQAEAALADARSIVEWRTADIERIRAEAERARAETERARAEAEWWAARRRLPEEEDGAAAPPRRIRARPLSPEMGF